jgi:HEAT repeat protein
MISYHQITDAADRRWTLRLLEQLSAPDLPDDELDGLVGALQAVSDPRSFDPLEAVVCDTARPAPVRHAAGSALRSLHHVAVDLPADKLRRWWREGDAVLRRIALLFMDDIHCPDILAGVAGDPMHPLQADALGRMDFGFNLPHQEAIKIAGLSHPDPQVRAAAACVLLWDEPVAAEPPLLQATHDLVPEAAAEAANTLQYYPSVRVLHRLHELLSHADDHVRAEAADSFASIRSGILVCLRGRDRRAADHIRRWLRPVWDLLAIRDEELAPNEEDRRFLERQEPPAVLPMADLLALLGDADASPVVLGDRLRSNGWSGYAEVERGRLRPVLLTHPDPLVREQATWAFATWRDARGLLDLLADANFCVRKSAMYNLGRLPPTPGLGDVAWNHLHRHDAVGTHATEILDTFVRHADPADAIRRLGWMAGDHGRREELRAAAVHHLVGLGAASAVGQLAGLLREPPEVSWALHLALLEAVAELGLPTPGLGRLGDVDHLDLQAALARVKE